MEQHARICKTCQQAKPLDQYQATTMNLRTGQPYRAHQCNACRDQQRRERYRSDPKARAVQIIHSMNANARVRHLSPIPVEPAVNMILSATHCAYCAQPNDGTVPFAVDHYLPVKLGGTNDLENIRVCCEPCNRAKHDSHPDAYLTWLSGVIHRQAQ